MGDFFAPGLCCVPSIAGLHTGWAISIEFICCSLYLSKQGGIIPGPSASLLSSVVILHYIYVLGAERQLAVTCVREVVALMESYTWQPSRQHWYVFKILSRNKTCFCYLLGQVGCFCLRWPPGAQGISSGAGDIPKERYTQGPCLTFKIKKHPDE